MFRKYYSHLWYFLRSFIPVLLVLGASVLFSVYYGSHVLRKFYNIDLENDIQRRIKLTSTLFQEQISLLETNGRAIENNDSVAIATMYAFDNIVQDISFLEEQLGKFINATDIDVAIVVANDGRYVLSSKEDFFVTYATIASYYKSQVIENNGKYYLCVKGTITSFRERVADLYLLRKIDNKMMSRISQLVGVPLILQNNNELIALTESLSGISTISCNVSHLSHNIVKWNGFTYKVVCNEISFLPMDKRMRLIQLYDTAIVSKVISSLQKSIWGMGGILFIIAMVLMFFIVRSSVRQLQTLAQTMGVNINQDLSLAYREIIRKAEQYQKERIMMARNIAVGQTASQIAHDVRKPLTSLKSLTMLLPEKLDDPVFIKDFSKRVEDSIDKTNSMLNEILEFSKDATSLERRNTDPQSIITSSLSDVFTSKKDISVEVKYDLGHQNYLNVDFNRIVRVITNILSNAVEAMNSVGIIWIETKEALNNRIEIRIGNNGPEISDDVQKKLFDPFFTKGKKGGTGLGLAICQKIVEMHGGSIKVESNNERTDFIVELPAGPGQLNLNEGELIYHSDELRAFFKEEEGRKHYTESENKFIFMHLHKEHGRALYLLVVDDEPLFRESVRTLLSHITQVRDHIKVVEADSVETAINILKKRHFDYVIADIDMGKDKMNGYDFVKYIIIQYPGIKTLLHSNKRREECDQEIRKIKSPDFMGFLPKPMKQSDLLQFLAQKSFEVDVGQKKNEKSKNNKKSVLILNDDDALLLSFKVMLKSSDLKIVTARNMNEALTHLSQNDINVIFSDINLGEEEPDGYEFLKNVKTEYSNIPVYMMSGYSEKEEGAKAGKNGAAGYIQLPVDKEQLIDLINQIP